MKRYSKFAALSLALVGLAYAGPTEAISVVTTSSELHSSGSDLKIVTNMGDERQELPRITAAYGHQYVTTTTNLRFGVAGNPRNVKAVQALTALDKATSLVLKVTWLWQLANKT